MTMRVVSFCEVSGPDDSPLTIAPGCLRRLWETLLRPFCLGLLY
jgi:hypothetical protein